LRHLVIFNGTPNAPILALLSGRNLGYDLRDVGIDLSNTEKMFPQQLRSLHGRAVVVSGFRLDTGGEMKTRVGLSRRVMCALLSMALLLAGGLGSPSFGRTYISAGEVQDPGEAGDPGDGDGVTAGGGASASYVSRVQDTTKPASPIRTIILLPVIQNGIITFQVLVIINRDIMRK
jgi:hypothetical protein